MPIELTKLANILEPTRTVLFFGSGSSIPSGAPSTQRLLDHLAKHFGQTSDGLSLSELAGIVERVTEDRAGLISAVRLLFGNLRPTGGLLNTPLYDWKNIYTTNYDELVEHAYSRRNLELPVYSSNFDFGARSTSRQTCLFKLHGTISKDVVDGHQSRLILSEADFDLTDDYREKLFDRLRSDLADSNLVIMGHSLADPDIKAIVNRAALLNQKTSAAGRIFLLMYTRDEQRALLHEGRGVTVAFGGIDEFFSAIAKRAPERKLVLSDTGDPLDVSPKLTATTTNVAHAASKPADPIAMFNGRAATVADITKGHTFERSVSAKLVDAAVQSERSAFVLLGACGVGKTTAARQTLVALNQRHGWHAWEHNAAETFQAKDWLAVARKLEAGLCSGIVLIDDAHSHVLELNDLIDSLAAERISKFKILAVSARHQWRVRVKTPTLFRQGLEFNLDRIGPPEVDRLLTLVDTDPSVRRLVENSFSGFSRSERRRRLIDRCESDLFVCLKNIFASESFNNIVLREFAELSEPHQDIYRYVSALENAGVRVHRQLVMRLLGIPAMEVGASLINLTDIISEFALSERDGIYVWQTRHHVIADIIAKHKFFDEQRRIDLYTKVVDNIQPSYDIELRTIRELCAVGIPRIGSRDAQNVLLRKIMSVAPSERVARHRLIRNLIADNQFEKAATEIRVFEKDLGPDGPLAKYKVDLLVARATGTRGLLDEDRLAILQDARAMAIAAVDRYPNRTNVLMALAEVGVEKYRISGELDVFDEAMAALRRGEERIGDPEITRAIARYERRVLGCGDVSTRQSA